MDNAKNKRATPLEKIKQLNTLCSRRIDTECERIKKKKLPVNQGDRFLLLF